MYIDSIYYKKYMKKIASINLSINIQTDTPLANVSFAYTNYYNLILDLIDEISDDIYTTGIRINLITDILRNETTNYNINFIAKFTKQDKKSPTYIRALYQKIFSIMIDAYKDSERDELSYDNLIVMMKKNIFLRTIKNKEFLLNHSEILKEIYNDELNSALTHICEKLSTHASDDLENNFTLTKILVNLSAALELPQVYVFSKKMLLDLSMQKQDYDQARIEIRDFEDMKYSTSEIKYYKAVLKQREPNNILRYVKHL